MSGPVADHLDDDPPVPAAFARPFLTRASTELGAADVGSEAPTDFGEAAVRAYMLTGGRTTTDAPHLRFESMVTVAGSPQGPSVDLTFEREKIAALCGRPQSVAELSAQLRVPIGVTRVLVGDLISDGVLHLYDPPTDVTSDIALVRELIDGIRNL